MNGVQIALEPVRVTASSATLRWRSTALQAKLGPAYRDEFLRATRLFIRTLLTYVPVLLKKQPVASVSETILNDDQTEWQMYWQPEGSPNVIFSGVGGVGSAALAAGAALAGLAPLGFVALLPVSVGVGVDAYRHFHRRTQEHEQALLEQVEFSQLQYLELSTAYSSLRTSETTHEQQVQDLEAMREALLSIASSFDQKQVVDGLVNMLTQVLRFDRALVLLRDRDENTLVMGGISHPPNDPQDMMRLNMLQILLEGRRQDSLVDEWLAGNPVLISQPSAYLGSALNSMLALLEFNTFYSVPLMLGNEMLGVVIGDNQFTRLPISPESRSLLDAVATNVAITLENARLYHLQDEQLRKNVEEMRITEQVDREMSDTLEFSLVLELLLDWALRFTGARLAIAMLLTEDNAYGYVAAFYGCQEEDLPSGQRGVLLPLEKAGIAGQAVIQRRTMVVNDISRDPHYIPVLHDMVAQVSVPITRRRRVVGVMNIETDKASGFTRDQVNFIQRLANRAGVALENARLYTETRLEREKLQAVLTTTQDAVIVVDHASKISLINPAALRAFALSAPAEQYIEQSFEQTLANSPLPDLLAKVRGDAASSFSAQVTVGQREYTAGVVHVPLVGHTFILHDVTVFREVDRLKSELVSTVSHDLKNPLSVMKGYAEMLDMTQTLNEKGKNYVQRIHTAIDGMRQLIDDLLDVAKIESGLHLELKPLHLTPLVDRVVDDLALRAEQKNIMVNKALPADLPSVMGEEDRLRQVITNLVSNAIKYTLPGGSVWVEGRVEAGYARLQVRDTGVGIAAEDQDRVWDRFERVANIKTADVEGSGLGLPIVKMLVEAHGGAVGLESAPDQGSNFWFTLPLTTEATPKFLT
ncbi:MAG: GAF domain-containing protein [Anaerolineae bacterium]|nr:GAF domain-containing protein [Anaerolineae bacterium]